MAYVAGIDVGSVSTKVLLLRDGDIVASALVPSGSNYSKAAQEVLGKALEQAGIAHKDLAHVLATGLGSASVTFADSEASDITCQGRGVHRVFPSARTVIDMGGQASKVIRVNSDGRVADFTISEKCAAGSGRFLQVIARVLQVNLDDVGPLSLKSKREVEFTTSCAVFAESEAISRIGEGAAKEDILAGVHRALAAKIASMVDRVRLEPDCAFTGGGAQDIGLVKSIEQRLGLTLLVPDAPRLTAALGAAITALERLQRQRQGVTSKGS